MLPPRSTTRPLVEQARAAGVEVTFLDAVHDQGLSLAAILRSATVLRRLRPAIVHFVLTSPRRCAETVIAAWLTRVPRRLITFQLVTPVPRFGRLAARARGLNRRLQYLTVHRGIAVSSGNHRLLVEQYGFLADRLALIPNGVDTEYFRPRPDDGVLRAQWGVPLDAPLLGVVGRLSRQKGHATLLAALPQVWAAFPRARLAVLGTGELEAALRSQAAQIDACERVHFVGQQQAMPRALAALDLFVLPSLYEGLSFAVLEAMAMQRAIVATAVDGTTDTLQHGRNGLVVPPGQPAPLAAAITELLGDVTRRGLLGEAARQVAVERFDQRRMLQQTFALYEEPALAAIGAS
jgi:glycosyltransferase involved in cell wall biosynthesis